MCLQVRAVFYIIICFSGSKIRSEKKKKERKKNKKDPSHLWFSWPRPQQIIHSYLNIISIRSIYTFSSFSTTEEMTQVRETAASENCTGTSLADILQSALPADNVSLPPASSCSVSSSTPTSSNSECNNKHNHVSYTLKRVLWTFCFQNYICVGFLTLYTFTLL